VDDVGENERVGVLLVDAWPLSEGELQVLDELADGVGGAHRAA
jgi:hypothetical protein